MVPTGAGIKTTSIGVALNQQRRMIVSSNPKKVGMGQIVSRPMN